MEYARAVELAPPGWRHFALQDLDRLPASARDHEMAGVPPMERRLVDRGDADATERVLRAMFWTLVYHLEPQRWDDLVRYEPIPRVLLDALPGHVEVSVDVGAGSGRLSAHLAARSDRVVAVEPSLGLGSILAGRVPSAWVIAGWAEHLPLPSHSSQLTAACGAFGPDPRVLAEMRRVTVPGGCIALINPESPEWFDERCWTRITTAQLPVEKHPSWIDEFFGPPDPPHELVMLRVR
jgi:SAM-dependent methyltransferase